MSWIFVDLAQVLQRARGEKANRSWPWAWMSRIPTRSIGGRPYLVKIPILKNPGTRLTPLQCACFRLQPLHYCCMTVSVGKLPMVAVTAGRDIAPRLTRVREVQRIVAVIYAAKAHRRVRIRLLINKQGGKRWIGVSYGRQLEIFNNLRMRIIPGCPKGGAVITHHAIQRITARPWQAGAVDICLVCRAAINVHGIVIWIEQRGADEGRIGPVRRLTDISPNPTGGGSKLVGGDAVPVVAHIH